jgi:hypothetical protein
MTMRARGIFRGIRRCQRAIVRDENKVGSGPLAGRVLEKRMIILYSRLPLSFPVKPDKAP